MRQILNVLILLVIVTVGNTSCTDFDSTYRDLVVPGGIIYTGKVVSPVVYPGNMRVKVSWLRGVDPTVTKIRVFWNNYADSIEIANPINNDDTIGVYIDNLLEDTYSFFIITYDDLGHTSVPEEILGTVYGERYQASLLNRPIESCSMNNGIVNIEWGNADVMNGAVFTEIQYVNSLNELTIMKVLTEDAATTIQDYKTEMQVRTVFVPSIQFNTSNISSIDTFYTDYMDVKVLSNVPKAQFIVLPLPGDSWIPEASNMSIENLWDNVINVSGNIFAPLFDGAYPEWVTIDMNKTVIPHQMRLYQRTSHPYHAVWVKSFEIWGTDDYNPDGSWDNWKLLGKFDSRIPSGSVWPKYTADDMNYQRAGEDFTFKQPLPAVRYIRFKVLQSYGGGKYQLSELSFQGEIIE